MALLRTQKVKTNDGCAPMHKHVHELAFLYIVVKPPSALLWCKHMSPGLHFTHPFWSQVLPSKGHFSKPSSCSPLCGWRNTLNRIFCLPALFLSKWDMNVPSRTTEVSYKQCLVTVPDSSLECVGHVPSFSCQFTQILRWENVFKCTTFLAPSSPQIR